MARNRYGETVCDNCGCLKDFTPFAYCDDCVREAKENISPPPKKNKE